LTGVIIPQESVGSGRRRKYGYLEASSASPISLGVERMPGDDRGSPSSLTDLDSALGGSTTSPDSTRKTHSDDLDGSIRSPPHSLPPSNFSRRNSWVRRSLRGSPSRYRFRSEILFASGGSTTHG
ncbi:putative rab11 family-interacting protein 4-like, partial [Homarus americanus]